MRGVSSRMACASAGAGETAASKSAIETAAIRMRSGRGMNFKSVIVACSLLEGGRSGVGVA